MKDESTYGFNKTDAADLVQLIGGADREHIMSVASRRGGLVCKTPGGGIAARSGTTVSSATCTVWKRATSTMSAGTTTLPVWNLSTAAVAATEFIVAVPTNIGYVAVWEDC
jgi:hypothetical protein